MDLFDGVRCYLGHLRLLAPLDRLATQAQRLAVLPAGDEAVASARLRSLPLLGLMEKTSVRSARGTSWLPPHAPDIVWIQKRLTASHLRTAARLKEGGCVLVYDCDEAGPDLDYWARPTLAREVLLLADVVTTDTPERGDALRELVPSRRVHVLENQVDYGNQLSTANTATIKGDGNELRVLWFGHGSNLPSLAAYRDVLSSLHGVRLVLCGPHRSQIRSVLGSLPVEVHRWSMVGFAEVLRGCHVTLLSHFGPRHHTAKSAHKMVTSICHGVPALVSATPDYSRVAALADITDDAVYASPEGLRARLERMKSREVRQRYIMRSRSILLARYGPGTFPAAAALLLRRLGGGAGAP